MENVKQCFDCGGKLDGENCPAGGVHDKPMSDIKQYKVISASNLDELQKLVNEHIDSGYYPIGGVSTSSSEQWGFGVFQAMMLPDDEFDFYEDKLREENGK